jgi:hypothetical protein
MNTFKPNGIITLTTDFGLDDPYVAIMKGVVLGIAPHATIVDYTHGVEPGNIPQAAHLLRSGCQYFPPGTVHVVVVDPGVGSDRRAVAIETPAWTFVGPDNGVLALATQDAQQTWGQQVRMIELTNQRFWRSSLSATFHGRDLFAPIAAHIAAGVQFDTLGRPLDALVPAGMQVVQCLGDGLLRGQIVHIDRFGNCITNITRDDLAHYEIGEQVVVEIIDQQIAGLVRTYADALPGRLTCLIGSGGNVEIAVPNGNAAAMLGVGIGDKLRVRRIEARDEGSGTSEVGR